METLLLGHHLQDERIVAIHEDRAYHKGGLVPTKVVTYPKQRRLSGH
jgi:hypothetical protein